MEENISVRKYVEVCSKEDGFLGSYFVAKVVGRVGKEGLKVEYTTLVSEEDENKRLREVVPARDVRPCPPTIEVAEFHKLQKVDAYDREGWWVGRVIGRVGGGDEKYCVHFDSTGDKLVYSGSMLRVHQEWEDGIWVPSREEVNLHGFA
ncbi:protein AGENET DOMAIN (AGD)-CONTAINING P1-like [Pistacia vera]|uniref:protein AGENET DOMAIN (AGD)-CONTAINING P1-like n=1 Tax=Pistacia vera TaxID=55513 RepID=UPI001263AD4F|nr:protein AGENET DOMAIN (AGD)-CONTAINING P1-like [Pistacia vera]